MATRLPGSHVSLLSLLALCYYCSPVLAYPYNGPPAGSAHASGSLVGSSPRLSDSQRAAELGLAGTGRAGTGRASTGLSGPAGRGGRSYRLDMTGQGPDRQIVSRPAATSSAAPATARPRQAVPLMATLARKPEIGAVPPVPPEPPAVTEPAPVPDPASPFSPALLAAARIAAASEMGHSTDAAA